MPLKLVKIKRSKNWYVRGTVRGCKLFESTGTGERPLARAYLEKRERDIWQSRVFHAIPFPEAVVNYLESGGEGRYLEPLLKRFRDTPINAIGQRDIDEAAKALYPRAMPSTRNRQVYTPMMAVLNHAASRGECEHIRIRRPRGGEAKTRWLTPDEAGMLIANCNDNLRPLVVFLIYTGCRLGEAIGLTWDRVDLGARTAWIPRTKNRQPRAVHLPPPVVVELANAQGRNRPSGSEAGANASGREYPAPPPPGFVFAYASRFGMRTAWKTAVRNARLDGLRPHDLRHTYATWLRQYAKLDLKGIMDAGGWLSIASVVRYAHTAPSEAAEAANRLPSVKNW